MSSIRGYRPFTRCCSLVVIALLLVGLPASSTTQGAGEKAPTNYEVIERISRAAIGELLANMPTVRRDLVIQLVKARGVGEIDFVFENTLLKTMRESGYRVAVDKPADGGEAPAYRFTYQIINLSLDYPEIGRQYVVGAKKVERLAEVGVFAQLADMASGDILWVGDTQKRYGDTIPYAYLKRVEDEAHGFTAPERNEIRWGRLVEPVIVTGIVTGLVYLFFSNQQND
ncbi:MAG: hypothetical protein JW876_10490 [Candidatus Krumholzibacteriota bacterium]|nr:hypothetical protein [Candidatus Krumholzibacteriota bacterium]